MNGGCRYETKTGWEPDNGFMGRPRRLFEMMGGDISEIPQTLLKGPSNRRLDKYDLEDPEQRVDWIDRMQAEWSPEAIAGKLWKTHNLELALDFPAVSLPKDSEILWEATSADAIAVQDYVVRRCPIFRESERINNHNPFLWSPKFKRYVIIPFIEKQKIIGWIARKIDPGKEYAHVKCPSFPSDYMLNQHLRFAYNAVLVMQGSFDALALRGLCTFGSVISKKQINLLNQLKQAGRKIVLVPDFKEKEWINYLNIAKEQGWYLSVPDIWGADGFSPKDYIKDPGDSIQRHGLLYTVETVMKSISNDYGTAEATLLMRSR